MWSVIDEIIKLRGNSNFTINQKNTNRHSVVVYEADGTQTAYCFSAPIYNLSSRKLVDLKFQYSDEIASTFGSSAKIIIVDNVITFDGLDGKCSIEIPKSNTVVRNERSLKYGDAEIFPTVNGLAFKVKLTKNDAMSFRLLINDKATDYRCNNKYFSVMSSEFKPYIVVSSIGCLDVNGCVIAPAEVSYSHPKNEVFEIKIKPISPYVEYVLFEINLHEPKLFQDTTVESKNSKNNNAFGGTAFIGDSTTYGEQWLYSRPELNEISEFYGRWVNKAVLYMPCFDKNNVALTAFGIPRRFCSFGSTWENKIGLSELIAHSEIKNGYQSFTFTDLITEEFTGYLTRCEGFILRSKKKDSGFSVISTGDSCYAPQIFEINFKR